uniref:Uncharacterized protein n=1 Tax=Siphoviridae sp. ctcfw7 TaxID=2826394 RepID=A0A8S5MH94_9CAUD|nr:MAG TPA: hypothetical protein [Siphoviridae sp. ctcfw7]
MRSFNFINNLLIKVDIINLLGLIHLTDKLIVSI